VPITLIKPTLKSLQGMVGNPLASAMQNQFTGKVTVRGVDYQADAAGFTGAGDGGKVMATDVDTAISNCPRTIIVLGGYE
jgi:cutinase